ncbi:hypothetical protein H8E65_10680, partial [Candidatus Bathyarchaeota archaeon]|nr:hypothetical protein [Candidatus Bathyarchaeota archaeon]
GMLIGVWLLVNLGIGSLKLYIGIIITLFALASLLGLRKDFEKEGTTYVVAGFLAGLLVHTRPPHSPLLPEPEDGEGDFQGQPHRVPPLPLPRHDPNVHLEWLDNLGVHEGLLNLRASPPLGGGRDRALSSHRRGIIQEVLVLVPLAGGMSIIAGLGII